MQRGVLPIPRVTDPTTRFTVDEFTRMVNANVFGTTRVELINGRAYRMAPQGTRHMSALSMASEALQRVRLQGDWIVIQGTLRLDRFTTVDPDMLWLAVPIGTPEHQWGTPLLLIEVSDTTYRRDSGLKLRNYARASVKDYWIVNLRASRIEVYRDPQNPTGRLADCRYAAVAHFIRGQSIPLLQRPQVSLAVDDLLP